LKNKNLFSPFNYGFLWLNSVSGTKK